MPENEDIRFACADCGFESDGQYMMPYRGKRYCAACFRVISDAAENKRADTVADRVILLSWCQSLTIDEIEALEADRPHLYRGLLNYLRCQGDKTL